MSVVSGRPKPLLVPYLAVSSNVYTVGVDLGIIKASPTANATWTLPALSSLQKGAFLWIDNQTGFTITLSPSGTDTINGAVSYVISSGSFGTLYTGSQWNASAYIVPPSGTSTNTNNGTQSLASLTSGTDDTAVGYQSMQYTTTGSDDTAVGYQALRNNVSGNTNSAFGSTSLLANTTGANNSAFGYAAGASNTIGTGLTAVGSNSLNASTGNNNTAVGYNSGLIISSGSSNTAIGQGAFPALTSGSTNIAIGSGSGAVLTTGSNNIYLGASAVTATEASTMRLGILGTQTTTYIAASPITGETSVALAANTISAASLAAGIATNAANITAIDTGANIDAQFPGIQTGNVIKLLIVNTGAGAITVASGGAAGITVTNAISIAQNDSRILYFRRTGAAAYTVF